MSSEPLFLTDDELEKLTGYKTAKKQIEFLLNNDIKFRVNGIGKVVITRSNIEGVKVQKGKSKNEPNYEALDKFNKGA